MQRQRDHQETRPEAVAGPPVQAPLPRAQAAQPDMGRTLSHTDATVQNTVFFLKDTIDLVLPVSSERAEHKAQEFERRLQPLIGQYPDETKEAIGLVRSAADLQRQADQAEAQGRTHDAEQLRASATHSFQEGLLKARSIPGIASRVNDLESVGADQRYIDAEKASFRDWGQPSYRRALAINEYTEFRIKNGAAIDAGISDSAAAAEVARLGQGARRGESFGESDYAMSMAVFRQVSAPIERFSASMEAAAILAGQMAARSGMVDEQFRKSMETLEKELKEKLEKMKEGTATKEDVEKAKEMTEAAKAAEEDLRGLSGDDAVAVSAIHGKGLRALSEGKSETARVQRQLAREYARSKDPQMREKLARWSKELAGGKALDPEFQRWLERSRPAEFKALTVENLSKEAKERAAQMKEKAKSYPALTRRISELDKQAQQALEEANALRKKGDLDGAKKLEEKAFRLLRESRAKALGLGQLERLDKGLAAIGEPPEMKKAAAEMSKALRGAFGFMGTEKGWRARLIMITAGIFLRHNKILKSKAAGPLLKGILGFVRMLADPEKSVDERKAKDEVGKLEPRVLSTALLDLKGKIPEEAYSKLTGALKAAAGMIGTNRQWRAGSILKAVRFFLDNRGKVGTKGKLFESLMGFLGRLADPKDTMSEEEAGKEFERIMKMPGEAPEKPAAPAQKPAEMPGAPARPAEKPVQPAAPAQKPAQPAAPVRFAGLVRLRRQRAERERAAPKAKGDAEAEGAAQALEQAGAPAEVVKAVRENRITDPRARAMMLDAAKFYADNIKTLSMPQMEQTKKFFEQAIAGLAGGKVAKGNYGKLEALLGDAKQFVSGFMETFKSYMAEANQKAIDDMEVQRSYASDPLLRLMLEAYISEARGYDKLIEGGEIDAARYDDYSKKLAIAEQAGTLLLGLDDPDTRRAVEHFLGGALEAAKEGRFEEARFQLLLAKEAAGGNRDYRKFLSSLGSDLESGKTDYDSARESLAGKMTASLDKDISTLSPDNPARASFSGFAASMRERGKDITIEELQKISDAKVVVSDLAQSEKLLSQKAHRDAKEGAYRIFERTASSFASGDTIQSVELQLYLGRRFIMEPAERDSVEKASDGYEAVSIKIRNGELDPQSEDGKKAIGAYFAYRTLSEKSDLLREERRKARNGSAEWKLYDKLAGELDMYRTKLANGEQVGEEDAKRVEGLFTMFFGSRGDMLGAFGLDADGILGNLGHVPSGDRQKAAQIGLYAFEAWEKGDMQAWAIYARSGAALASPDKALRKDVIRLAGGYHDGKVAPSRAEWMSSAYLSRASVERNIGDKKLLRNVDAYFKQVVNAYDSGDLNGAQSGLDILALYGENSALGKAADKDAAAFVDAFFGPGGIFAGARKGNITFAQAYAEAKGIQYSQDSSASIITGIEYETRSRRMHVSEKAFVKENDGVFLSRQKKKEREYQEEKTRIDRRVRKARKSGDDAEATRLEQEASYVDYAWVLKMSKDSKALYSRGVQLFDEALELRRKAAAEPAKAGEYEAQAARMEQMSQKYIMASGNMLGGLRTFDKSVTALYTRHRERGRENLWKGISGISEVGTATLGGQGLTGDDDKRLQGYYALAGVGNQEVSKQESIQAEKRKLLAWFKQLEEKNKKIDEQYKDVRWGQYLAEEEHGGYNHYEYWKWDDPNRPQNIGWNEYKDKWRVVHDKVTVDAEITKGRNYAYAENFDNSRSIAKKTDAKLTWSSVAGWAVKEEERLKGGERPVGDYYFDIISYQKDMEVAWSEIQKGNYGRADRIVKNVSDRVTVDGAHQEMDNLAWDLENKASYLDSERNDWDHFDPMLMARGSFDSKAEKKYKEYIEYLKTHKATIISRDKYGQEKRFEYIPFEVLKKSYDEQKGYLLSMAKGIKDVIPDVKTVEDVRLGRLALGEIQANKDSAQAFLDPLNTKSNTDQWVTEGKMTVGGQSYLLAFSGHAFVSKGLADAEQGWMVAKDSYTMAVESFMPSHYLLRTDKLEKYGGNLQLESNRWLQLADNFAADPKLAEIKIISGRNIILPQLEEKEIGDVKISGDSFSTDVPGLIGAISTLPFESYMKMSGENFLGYSGIGLWDDIDRISHDSSQKIILASWGYGFNPGGGRVIDPGDIDTFRLPVYAGKWVKMDFSKDERETILNARQGLKQLTGEFFGDAIKLNDYMISDKSAGYFTAKGRAMDDWGKAVDVIADYQLHKEYYDGRQQKKINHARRMMEESQKKYHDTGDYRYYSESMDWAGKLVELDNNQRVEEANRWIRKGDERSEETRPMMEDAASKEQWAGPIKVVGYGITIVATGGTGAFVIGFKETVSSINNFKFQIQMAGGYDNLSTKEKVLGWGGIGLSALGAVSPAFSELGLAAQGTKIGALTTAMNWTLVGGGIAMSVYQLPDLYRAWQSGEMSGLAFAGNFFANMQPALQIGIFGLSPKPISNRYLRVTSAILFGTPLSEHTPPLIERENYAVAYSKMPEYNRAAFAELETRVGGLSTDEAVGVMRYFKDTPIPLDWAEGMVREYRTSHALPEGVKPGEEGSLSHFEKVPLDKFAERYEEAVAFPEESGHALPRPKPEQKPAEGGTRGGRAAKEEEGQAPVSGEFTIRPAVPEPAHNEPKVVVEMPLSARFMKEGQLASLHPPEKGGAVMVTAADGTSVERSAYHNVEHTENVARMAYDITMKRPFTENDAKVFGSREEKAEFIGKVGLLHDVDPTRQAGKPARVAATLGWMDSPQGQQIMREQFGWNDRQISMAKAMIQRTEFPFDNAKVGEKTSFGFPRGKTATYEKDTLMDPEHPDSAATDRISTYYENESPLERYTEMLHNMDEDARAFVINEAPVLSEYADKASWYFGDPVTVFKAVEGLGTEGLPNPHKGTYGFLSMVGKKDSFNLDREVASGFGVELKVPYMEDVLGMLGQGALDNWDTTLAMYREISRGTDPKAALLEYTVGRRPGSTALEGVVAGSPDDIRASARVLESIVPTERHLSADELAAIPADYRPAAEAMNKASEKEREMWAKDPGAKAAMAKEYAEQVVYSKGERAFMAELDARGVKDEAILEEARKLYGVFHGQEVPRGREGAFRVMGDEVYTRVQKGMNEADAILEVVGARPAAEATRASADDIRKSGASAAADAQAFAITGVVESGRVVIAGSEYGNGVRASNSLWFKSASEVTAGISLREEAHAAGVLEGIALRNEPVPAGEGEYFQTNALLGNGNSDERGMIIVVRRPRDYASAAREMRAWMEGEKAAGREPKPGDVRAKAAEIVRSQGSHMDTFTIAIDKSGLGDIDRTTGYYLDPAGQKHSIRMGNDPASVISRELFGDMMYRAGEILEARAKQNGGRLTGEDIDAAMAQVKAEAMGSRRIPDEYVAPVAETRDILRGQDISEREAAAKEGRGFRPISRQQERDAAAQVLRKRLGHEPDEKEVSGLLAHLHTPDPRTYNVQVGPDPANAGKARTVSLETYASEYLGRGNEMLAAFAHGTIRETPKAGGAPVNFGSAYERAEQRQATYTHPLAKGLGIPTEGPAAVTGVDEHGIARLPKSAELPEGSVVAEVRFRLTTGSGEGEAYVPGGRDRALNEITEHVRAAADLGRKGKAERVKGLMEEFSIGENEATKLLEAYDNGKLTTEMFFELVPRKGVLFASGEWGFSEGNTALGHYGMNALAQAVSDTAAEFPGVKFADDNLTVVFPPGTSADTVREFYRKVNQRMPEAGGMRTVEAVGSATATDSKTTVGDFKSKSAAAQMGIDPRGVEPLTYIVHGAHPSRRDRLYNALFGDEGGNMMAAYGDMSRPQRISALDTATGAAREKLLLSSSIEEIRGNRSLRRPRDVLSVFDEKARAAESNASWAQSEGKVSEAARFRKEAAYWREISKALRDYSVQHGDDFIIRYHGGTVSGPKPGGAPPAQAPAGGGAGAVEAAVESPRDAVAKVDELGLATPGGLADFARKVALGDKEAIETLAKLPEPVRNVVGEITGDPAFVNIAKSDTMFNSYFGDRLGLGRKILAEYSGRIAKAVEPGTESGRMRVAAGAEGEVFGEITAPQPKEKEVKHEPKVVVEDLHGGAAGELEDLTAPYDASGTRRKGPQVLGENEIIAVLAQENHPRAGEALESFAKLLPGDQQKVVDQMHAEAGRLLAEAAADALAGNPVAAQKMEKGTLMQRQAIRLGEILSLSGEMGSRLESELGLRPGELAEAYSGAASVEDGRKAVAAKLGLTVERYSDDSLFGVIMTGGLVNELRGMYPGAQGISIGSIGGGATGAYPIKVTDSAGAVHMEFLKTVDMTADKAGAENLRLSGIPSPEVVTTDSAGRPLTFRTPEGVMSGYGLSRSIGEFSGPLDMGGRAVQVRTEKAVPLLDMEGSPELMDIFLNHPDAFWKEMGYLNAAGFAVGAVDGHQGNVFGMILEVADQSPRNIKALQDSGFYVFEDKGTYKLFRLGRIDTDDSAGTYMAKGGKGKFDFSYYEGWMGEHHVYPRLMLHLTRVRNEYEARSAGTWHFDIPPQAVNNLERMGWTVEKAPDGSYFIDAVNPDQVTRLQRVGLNPSSAPSRTPRFVSVRGLVESGLGRGKGPFYEGVKAWMREHDNPGYRKSMEDSFRSHEGQSAGVSSFKLRPDQAAQLASEGVTYMSFPNNGEDYMPVFYYDGRTRLMADYEKLTVDPAVPEIAALFPQGQLVFVAPVTKAQAASMPATFAVGKKYFAVFPSYDSIPTGFRESSVPASRHHDIIRAAPGFGKMTGFKTSKAGSVQVFDYIMDGGVKRMVSEYKKIEAYFLAAERKEEGEFAKGGIAEKKEFLNQRIPIGFGPEHYPTVKP